MREQLLMSGGRKSSGKRAAGARSFFEQRAVTADYMSDGAQRSDVLRCVSA
jgi:hypothetical protein